MEAKRSDHGTPNRIPSHRLQRPMPHVQFERKQFLNAIQEPAYSMMILCQYNRYIPAFYGFSIPADQDIVDLFAKLGMEAEIKRIEDVDV